MPKELTALAPLTMKIKLVAPNRCGLKDLSCFSSSSLSRSGSSKGRYDNLAIQSSTVVFVSLPCWRATFSSNSSDKVFFTGKKIRAKSSKDGNLANG